jgi:hypothetical protein
MKFLIFLERVFSDKIGYFSQKQLGKSVGRQLVFLFLIAASLILLFGCIFILIGVKFEQGNVFWFALLSLLGPDSLYTIQNESAIIKTFSLILTFFGIIIFNGIIIAIVVSTIHSYLDEIRRGTGKVHEENAIVILGWNELVPSILSELNLYSQTERKRLTVIVLSEEVKEESIALSKLNKNIEILFRTGASYKTSDLKRLNLDHAKAILVFYNSSKKEFVDHSTKDSFVIKTFISLHSLLIENEKSVPILLNFNDIENSHYLDYIQNRNAVFFNKNYYSAKFISLLLLNPYYYNVFHEILSYEGNEFHFYQSKSFVKKTFAKSLVSFPSAIPIGVRRHNHFILAPPYDFILEEEDELILLAENEKSIQWKERDFSLVQIPIQSENKRTDKELGEKIAIIGMNSRVLFVIEEFEKLERQIYIYANESELNWKKKLAKSNLDHSESEIFIYPCEFDTEMEIIEKIPLEKFDKVLVLSSEEVLSKVDYKTEDTDTLFKVLKLIHLKKKNPEKYKYQILCEIQNPENEEIVKKIPESNFNYVLGNLIVAKIITMELINPGIIKIFEQLLQKGEIDLDIQPLSNFFSEKISFQILLESFYKDKNWILIGFIDSESDKIILNPSKYSLIHPQDKIIYIAESDYKITN